MLFQIESDRFESAYADLLERINNAMQQTFHEEKEAHGLTKTNIAQALDVDLSIVSRRLNGGGNITLKTISDMYTAMGREPLSNFVPPRSRAAGTDRLDQSPARQQGQVVDDRIEASTTSKPDAAFINPSMVSLSSIASPTILGATMNTCEPYWCNPAKDRIGGAVGLGPTDQQSISRPRGDYSTYNNRDRRTHDENHVEFTTGLVNPNPALTVSQDHQSLMRGSQPQRHWHEPNPSGAKNQSSVRLRGSEVVGI